MGGSAGRYTRAGDLPELREPFMEYRLQLGKDGLEDEGRSQELEGGRRAVFIALVDMGTPASFGKFAKNYLHQVCVSIDTALDQLESSAYFGLMTHDKALGLFNHHLSNGYVPRCWFIKC